MPELNEWNSDYFNYSKLADKLWNYLGVESEEEALKFSSELLQTKDIIAFGAVADVFLEHMPDRRWGKMNPYWSLKGLLRRKAREILLRSSKLEEVEDQQLRSRILMGGRSMALSVLSFVGYEEQDIEIAWQILSSNFSEPKLISSADDVIHYALPYVLNISTSLRNKLIDYYSKHFLEKQSPYHLYILNTLGGNQVAEILETAFLLNDEKRQGIKSRILEAALYSSDMTITNKFRPIAIEYSKLYTEMYENDEIKRFPLTKFRFKSVSQILKALDALESVMERLKAEDVSIEERIDIVDTWLTEEVFNLLGNKLNNLDFFRQLPIQISAYIIERLLDFNLKNYANILKLMSIAEKLFVKNESSLSKVLLKANQMLPMAREFNKQNQLYPMD